MAPGGDDDLGTEAVAETMATFLEFGAQLAEIVDLTIIGERDELVIARHRLRAALDVDDRETEMRKADAGRRPFARPVGAAMLHRLEHRAQAGWVDRFRSEEHTS